MHNRFPPPDIQKFQSLFAVGRILLPQRCTVLSNIVMRQADHQSLVELTLDFAVDSDVSLQAFLRLCVGPDGSCCNAI